MISFSTFDTLYVVLLVVSLLVVVGGMGLFVVMHARDAKLERRWRQIQLERWLKQQIEHHSNDNTPCG